VSGGLDGRLSALAEVVELADGRLDPAGVAEARAVVDRAGQRLGLGVEATVVALAGPTGAGKSTLFNALAGAEIATASRRRPTTAAAAAAIWGEVPDALLDWLEVGRRHRMPPAGLDGLVLLDLPDFDSVERSHRLEVDRVVGLADLVVWVADPQKYADASLHERYLARLTAYEAAMLVVLNQADLLAPDARAATRADLARLLAAEGLPQVPVLAVSARTGEGLPELRRILAQRVAAREAAAARLAADVTRAAVALGAGCANEAAGRVGAPERERLLLALEEAAGVPTVVRAVEGAHRRRGALATGWPLVRWVRRVRPDPLRRLRLADRPEPAVRPSLPAPTPVQRAQVAAATRALATAASGSLPQPWPALTRRAATSQEDALPERLAAAVSATDLRLREPRWWRLAGALQALLAAAALLGALWLLVLVALGWVQLGDVLPLPEVEGLPVPTLALGGGVLLGLLLALLCGLVNGWGARRRAKRARRALRRAVEAVAAEDVIAPVDGELAAHERLCAALGAAAGDGRPGPLARVRRTLTSPVGAVAAAGRHAKPPTEGA